MYFAANILQRIFFISLKYVYVNLAGGRLIRNNVDIYHRMTSVRCDH